MGFDYEQFKEMRKVNIPYKLDIDNIIEMTRFQYKKQTVLEEKIQTINCIILSEALRGHYGINFCSDISELDCEALSDYYNSLGFKANWRTWYGNPSLIISWCKTKEDHDQEDEVYWAWQNSCEEVNWDEQMRISRGNDDKT